MLIFLFKLELLLYNIDPLPKFHNGGSPAGFNAEWGRRLRNQNHVDTAAYKTRSGDVVHKLIFLSDTAEWSFL